MLKEVGCFPGHSLCLLCYKEPPGGKGLVKHPDDLNALGVRDVKQHILADDQAKIIPDGFQ